MMEELCRNAFYTACCDKKYREGLVYLKGRPKPDRPVENFQIDQYMKQDYHFLPIEMFLGRGRRVNSVRRMAWVWFSENSKKIRDAYIRERYGGDFEQAMVDAGNFETLFGGFCRYFADRRTEFMEKTQQILITQKAELSKKGKAPQSHGGVANLLKVLTKTMQEQGSSIYCIAKVQYAVCVQAGIYIPEEFLTDVLIANEMLKGGDG